MFCVVFVGFRVQLVIVAKVRVGDQPNPQLVTVFSLRLLSIMFFNMNVSMSMNPIIRAFSDTSLTLFRPYSTGRAPVPPCTPLEVETNIQLQKASVLDNLGCPPPSMRGVEAFGSTSLFPASRHSSRLDPADPTLGQTACDARESQTRLFSRITSP